MELIVTVLYFVGVVVAIGAIGVVRDEMVGRADLPAIILWPVALALWIFAKAAKALYRIGRHFGA